MNIRPKHVLATLALGALVITTLGAAFVTVFDKSSAQAICGTGSSVTLIQPSNTASSTALTGVQSLRAYATPSAASGMTFMITGPTQQPIGEGVQHGSEWRLDWDSRNLPNGTYQMIAIAHFGTATTLDCASPVANVSVQNQATQAPKLTAQIIPNTWQGPVGGSANFSVDAVYVDQYGRSSHVGPATANAFTWQTSTGRLSTNAGISTVFTAGTTAGTGTLTATVNYGGLTAKAVAQLKVVTLTDAAKLPSSSPAPSPDASPAVSTSGGATTTDDATRLATMPTIFRPSDPSNSNPVVPIPTLSCLEKKIGSARFAEVSSGKSAPTAAERKQSADCFEGTTPIPAILAPVAPSHLTEVEVTKSIVSVSDIKTTTITSKDGKKIDGLLVSGKGAPSSDIFVYIFSDPLVLRAQTDAKGQWSYILETPLAPGHHEVYAVAEKDAGNFVRTSALPISIAAAAPGSKDGSLVIERRLSAAQVAFIIGAGLAVLATIVLLFALLRRRKLVVNTAVAASPAPSPEVTPTILPTTTPAAPAAPTTPGPPATAAPPAPAAQGTPATPASTNPAPHDPQA